MTFKLFSMSVGYVFLKIHLVTGVNPLSANPQKWSNRLKHELPTNCLSVFDYFVGLALKGLKISQKTAMDF